MTEGSQQLFNEIVRIVSAMYFKGLIERDDFYLVIDRLFCTRDAIFAVVQETASGDQSGHVDQDQERRINRVVGVVNLGMGRVRDEPAQPHRAKSLLVA